MQGVTSRLQLMDSRARAMKICGRMGGEMNNVVQSRDDVHATYLMSFPLPLD